MEGVILFLLFLVIIGVVLYPHFKRHYLCSSFRQEENSSLCGPCGKSNFRPPSSLAPGVCFPGTTFPVKGGLIDLRNCSDEVYILGDKRKVNFITIS